MSHGPATDWGQDKAAAKKTRLGILMFVVYALVYAAFVIVTTIDPHSMETVILGQNLAVIYGFGLIIFALILALIYNAISTGAEDSMNGTNSTDEEERS